MKQLKIAFLLLSKHFGGAERTVYEILKSLQNNPQVKIDLITNSEIIKNYSNLRNVSKFNLGSAGNNFFHLRDAIPQLTRRLSSHLHKNNYSIINLHMDESIEIFGRLNEDFLPIPISTFHGTDLVLFSESLIFNKEANKKNLFNFIKTNYYKKFIIPYLLASIDKSLITLIGKYQIDLLPLKYKEKCRVIPNGVDAKIFKPLKNIKSKKNVILFAGRFIEIKGIREILNVAKQFPRYEFWFAGQGPLENEIRGKNIKNLGFQNTEKLVKLYNQATICIFPSYRESFGLVGLEAMSCGKAVIATPLGFSEYIENGKDGIIIPAKDEIALKDAIVDLMTNEKKRKMLEKNARKKALNYSWDIVAKQYLKVFKEVLIKGENEKD